MLLIEPEISDTGIRAKVQSFISTEKSHLGMATYHLQRAIEELGQAHASAHSAAKAGIRPNFLTAICHDAQHLLMQVEGSIDEASKDLDRVMVKPPAVDDSFYG